MVIGARQIKELKEVSLEQSAAILRRAFGEVSDEFGITAENTPMYAAYTTAAKLEEMMARGVKFFGLFIGGSQVGLVALENESDGDYHMKRLAVLPEYWHDGLGRELVDYVIDFVRKLGVDKLRLGMVNGNTILKQWYLEMGFRETQVIKYEHLPFFVCHMELDLL